MKKRVALWFSLWLGWTGISASPQALSEPPCPYSDIKEAPDHAGCFIMQDRKLLMVKLRLSRKLDYPGGTKKRNENPQCTAFRETYEETGLVVDVHELLAEFNDGYKLYRCTTVSPDTPLEIHDKLEVLSVDWRSEQEIPKSQWRFPENFDTLIRLMSESRSARN